MFEKERSILFRFMFEFPLKIENGISFIIKSTMYLWKVFEYYAIPHKLTERSFAKKAEFGWAPLINKFTRRRHAYAIFCAARIVRLCGQKLHATNFVDVITCCASVTLPINFTVPQDSPEPKCSYSTMRAQLYGANYEMHIVSQSENKSPRNRKTRQ